jgi:hypothetical protein
MAIQFEDLLNAKANKFGASATSVDFQQKAMDSCNYVLDDIENSVGIATSRIDTNEDEIDLDQQKYEGALSCGMDYYLCLLLQYQVQSIDRLWAIYERKLSAARRVYLSTESVYGPRGDMTSDD